jgi:hypothetical protein
MLRANLKNEDLDFWNSVQQNLVWAALPFALRMRQKNVPNEILQEAQAVNADLQGANTLSRLGKSPKAFLERIQERLNKLKPWGERNGGQVAEPS